MNGNQWKIKSKLLARIGNIPVSKIIIGVSSVGKVANSQVGVFVGYSGPKGYGLISARLFMPEKWFDEEHKQLN
ncbi:hypothetical protein [Desulfosporosinus sp. BICA1-9]|uniref:hypothetical protein n=1 Tax=Desulfosporosinus sp. BICA1-9 TaxID=1531958 RepID=UPI00054BDC66|nr:hypothetical protein [Desulfosporosinus sp. BICA1-9]KJS47010.1 MAG: hypothetical protein VR66_22140 [Peptococcaceae bacterium BRH_c23]KJS82207.1 MAG: hypothetical protein JL57_24995 [Desulfosporosinus sp. BICA1-9]HBW35252.1 hypothetical protein [Desulfosporosinus sp.]